MGLVVRPESFERYAEQNLTDATDDHDFVTADDGDPVFTALDGERRTDTWLNDSVENAIGTKVLDPDTDDAPRRRRLLRDEPARQRHGR